ncbi:Calreticulin-3 protein [Spatholobus suberectus]|nr:Calreticulin-3 protein [Spatholobus suberectus]
MIDCKNLRMVLNPDLYILQPIKCIGIEVWPVKAGSVYDHILIYDDPQYAKQAVDGFIVNNKKFGGPNGKCTWWLAFSDEEDVRFEITFLGNGVVAGILHATTLEISDKRFHLGTL